MATRQAQKRLTREYKHIQESPIPYIEAHPNEAHILEWHYVITGPPDTPYDGGQYHGTLVFPADYPFKPPAIRMMTPSGRFKTNTRLCLSISDYHPKSWNPAWSVSTILTGLLSFMVGDESTAGSINSSDAHKRAFSKDSHRWNVETNRMFCDQFPEMVEENKRILSERVNTNEVNNNTTTSTTTNASTNTNKSPSSTASPADDNNNVQKKGFFGMGKVFGVCVLLVSWILASRLFGTV